MLLPHIESPRLLPKSLNLISLFTPISPVKEPKPPAQTHRLPNTPPPLHTSVSASEMAGTSLGRSSWMANQRPGKESNCIVSFGCDNCRFSNKSTICQYTVGKTSGCVIFCVLRLCPLSCVLSKNIFCFFNLANY